MATFTDIPAWVVSITDSGGTNTFKLIGTATDVQSPTLERAGDQTKRAGESGVIFRHTYFEQMELSCSIRRVHAEVLNYLNSGIDTITMTAIAAVANDSGTLITYSWEAVGYTNLPFGLLNADGFEAEISMMVNKLTVNINTDTHIIDPANFEVSYNGTNKLQNVKDIIDPPPV